jgi:SAM-dependent methyltransferase
VGVEGESAREWLERRFSRDASGRYFAHQPIYGFASTHSEPGHLQRLARTLHMLRAASRLGARTMLDVGGGEGYFAFLCRELLGVSAAMVELPQSACDRAGELLGIPAVSADAARLPFTDNSFDLIVCSEVMEHVETPHVVAAELMRVAGKHVLITTEQFCCCADEQNMRLRLRDPAEAHPDRNFYTQEDMRTLFGGPLYEASEYWDFIPRDEAKLPPDKAKRLVLAHSRVEKISSRATGVVYLAGKDGTGGLGAPKLDEKRALKMLFAPLIASPETNPQRTPAHWPPELPAPIAIDKQEVAMPPAPDWARKFEMGNIAQGFERVRLSRWLRKLDRWKLLNAPEPLGDKLGWLLRRALRLKK